jgi:hypothetical protein
VDIPGDFIRRELKEVDGRNRAVIRGYARALERLAGADSGLPDRVRRDLLSGGLHRRRFLAVGSASVLASAVFAACGGSGASTAATGTTTTVKPATPADVTILRTASSIEALAVAVYQKAMDSGLVKTPALVTAAQVFQDQHTQHGELFQRVTTSGGGQPYTKPNPVLMQHLIAPRLAALKTESDVITLAHDVENLAAETYQNNVGAFDDKTLNGTMMQVGGIEARHVAVLASAIGKPANPDGSFQTVTNAVAPGTGLSA